MRLNLNNTIIIKKVIAVFFIAFSIISCSTEENENLKKSVNSDEKKQEILNQFNELGGRPRKGIICRHFR